MARQKARSRSASFSALFAIALSGATASSLLVSGAHPALAGASSKAKPKAAPTPKAPTISEEHKKALEELRGAYSFGMTKDDVLAVLAKQIDEAYADRLKSTTDVRKQDKLRAEKKKELADIKDTYMEFDGTVTGWDVSLIDTEFGHKNQESVLEYWENEDGKSQRRFFFFDDGVLYKMALSLDVSDIPAKDRTFETFKAAMEGRYGAGAMDAASITWSMGNYRVVAKDKLLRDKALMLVMSDVEAAAKVEGRRVAKVKATDKVDSVTKAVIDRGGDSAPALGEKSGATDVVIKASGSK
jgi:hypothetical protein